MKQLLDEVEQNIINYQNWGPSYLPKSKTEKITWTQGLIIHVIMQKRIQ